MRRIKSIKGAAPRSPFFYYLPFQIFYFMQQVQLRITGKVQGVFFRASTRQKALELGITGWVKNEADGSVLAVGQGEPTALQEWVDWCHRGPAHARVDQVREEVIPLSDFQQFEIKR